MNRPLLALAALLLLAATASAQENQPPSASFSLDPAKPVTGEVATFTSTSHDPDGDLTNWTWEFGDGVVRYGPSVTHVFAEAGVYVVQLAVTDDASTVALTGQRVTVVVPTLDDPTAFLPAWMFWAMPLLVSAILFALAYLVLQRGQPAIYNLVFFLLYLASGAKSLTESFAVLTQSNPGAHQVVLEINESLAYVYGPLFLWFVLVFPRPVHPWFFEGRRGAVTLLLAVPFLLNQAFGWLSFDAVLNYFNGFVALLALGCLGVLLYHGWETDSDEERARIRFLAIAFGLAVFNAVVLAALNVAYTYQAAAGADGTAATVLRSAAIFGLIVGPTLEILGATVMMYAILRYQLMGVQSLVVKVTRGAVTALMVPSTFIIVGNLIEEIFQSILLAGVSFDFIIAGFVSALLMVPVQKFTTFVMNKFMPALSAEDESARRVEIYATQLRYSLLDGALNDGEVQMLQRLAAEIKLKPDELRQAARGLPRSSLGTLSLGILGPESGAAPPSPTS